MTSHSRISIDSSCSPEQSGSLPPVSDRAACLSAWHSQLRPEAMLSVVLAAFTLHATTSAYRTPALRHIANHGRYNTLVLHASPTDNMLAEQLQEFIEGVEKFQEEAYNSVYGKDVRFHTACIRAPLALVTVLKCRTLCRSSGRAKWVLRLRLRR